MLNISWDDYAKWNTSGGKRKLPDGLFPMWNGNN